MLATKISICEHFDSSIDAKTRYYHSLNPSFIQRLHGNISDWVEYWDYDWDYIFDFGSMTESEDKLIQPYVNSSCIGKSRGKDPDKCKFNGFLSYDELCNPCEVKEFKEECEELCVTTTGPPFAPFKLM